MPAIHMSDEERDSLFLLAQSPAPAGAIPAEHATRFVALGLAVRETLRFRITLRGQVEILRQRFRKMPLSRVAKVTKKHFLATFEERFSHLPLLGQRAQSLPREAPRRNSPPSPPKPRQPRNTAPGGMPPPNPGLPPQRQGISAPPAEKGPPPGQQPRPPAGQQMRPQAGQPLRPQGSQPLRPQGGQQMRPQGGQPPRPAAQPGKNPQGSPGKGPPPRPKQR